MKDGGTLGLSSGSYVFEEIKGKKNAVLSFDVSGGPIIIEVEKKIDLQKETLMTSTGPASEILFLVAGDKVTLHKDGTYLGTFVAPHADIELDEGSTFTGALYGDKVKVKKDTSLSGAPAVALFVERFVLP